MLLERLKEYAKRVGGDISPPGYDKTFIKWIVPLDEHGKLLGGLIPTVGRGGKYDRGREYMAPHRLRTSTAIRPKLLADNGQYALGVSKSESSADKQRKRVAECHKAFVELIRECADQTGEPSIKAVSKFLDRLNSPPRLPNDFDPSHNVTFQVNGTLPMTLPVIQQFWADYFWTAVLAGEDGDEEGEEGKSGTGGGSPFLASPVGKMECLVCGEAQTPVSRHPFQIKGIPGRRAGAALISANSVAFESYSLKASLIAPTCRNCADVYVKAANLLIQDESTSISIGPCIYIFWTKEDCGFSIVSLLSTPQSEEVKTLINSGLSGKRRDVSIESTPFYAVALTTNRSRVVVRDWLETTVERAKENLARWFTLQSIIGEWGEAEVSPLPIQGYLRKESKQWVEGLAECTVPRIKQRRNIQDVNPNVPEVLLHVALKGGPIPMWLLFQAVDRNRAEQGVTRGRAALIKMVLLSRKSDFAQEGTMVKLDSDNKTPAYLCGRLLAVLEAIQRAAIPGAKATITDRFFGTASSAPASVFGRLIRGSQPHLGKLRKDRRGTYEALEKRLEEVQAGLPAFPKTLTLEEQGLFGLGYYHQRASDRAAANAYNQEKEQ